MTRFVRQLADRINGKRGWFLILYSVAFFGFGLSYLQFPETPGRRDTFQFLPLWLPLQWVAVLWWGAAIAAFIAAFLRSPNADRIGFAALVFVLFIWGFIFLATWIAGYTIGGWTSTFTYWTFAALVRHASTWPNPSDARRLPAPPHLMDERGTAA